MSPRRELIAFSVTLAAMIGGSFAGSLVGGQGPQPGGRAVRLGKFRRRPGARV